MNLNLNLNLIQIQVQVHCNDGTRPVVFKLERIDIPESPDEEAWLAAQDFSNSAEDAYTG